MSEKSWFPASWGNREAEPFRGVRTQLDTLFEDWFGRTMGGTLAPRIDVSETGTEMKLTVELPGVEEKDIDISLAGNQLTIKGEKRSERQDNKDEDGRVFRRTERSYGAFRRTVTIPFEADPDSVAALFRDGVLTITLPKPADAVAQAQPRRIEVRRWS